MDFWMNSESWAQAQGVQGVRNSSNSVWCDVVILTLLVGVKIRAAPLLFSNNHHVWLDFCLAWRKHNLHHRFPLTFFSYNICGEECQGGSVVAGSFGKDFDRPLVSCMNKILQFRICFQPTAQILLAKHPRERCKATASDAEGKG